jgi:hypothetical protein
MRGNRKMYNKHFDTVDIHLKLRQRREWKLNLAILANKSNPRTIMYRMILKMFILPKYFYLPLARRHHSGEGMNSGTKIIQLSMNNLSDHADVPC